MTNRTRGRGSYGHLIGLKAGAHAKGASSKLAGAEPHCPLSPSPGQKKKNDMTNQIKDSGTTNKKNKNKK